MSNDDETADQAHQNARDTDVAQQHGAPGAWDGPFVVGKPDQLSINGTDFDVVDVLNIRGGTMATVWAHLCEGSDIPSMKARATRIAECLNRDQQLFERGLAQQVWQDESGDPFPWMVESRGVNVPHFVVTLTGECWWDIERNLADARKRLHHTAPPQEDQK